MFWAYLVNHKSMGIQDVAVSAMYCLKLWKKRIRFFFSITFYELKFLSKLPMLLESDGKLLIDWTADGICELYPKLFRDGHDWYAFADRWTIQFVVGGVLGIAFGL